MLKYIIANGVILIFIAGLFELMQIANRRYWRTSDDSVEETLWNVLRIIFCFLLIILVAAFALTTIQIGYLVCIRALYA